MDEHVYSYCLRLLNIKQYSKSELKRKILRKFPEFCDFDALFSKLEDGHLIDDRKFAENYILSGMKRGWGRRKIIAKLREKGINIDDLSNFDYSFIVNEVKRRFPISKYEYKRIRRFLLQRGFTFEESDKIISRITGDGLEL